MAGSGLLHEWYFPELPDSRPHSIHRVQDVQIGRLLYEKCYCANCGADGGAVPKGTAHVFYLCDNCDHIGKNLGLPALPEELVRGGLI